VWRDPYLNLALSLSTPPIQTTQGPTAHLGLDLTEQDVTISIPRTAAPRVKKPHLLASKDTISFALLLYHVWERLTPSLNELAKGKPPIYEGERFENLAGRLSRVAIEYNEGGGNGLLYDSLVSQRRNRLRKHYRHLLGVDARMLRAVDQRVLQTFRTLENEGLICDPAITGVGGLMVLLGLIPVRWSVRTPKGQGVYREIKVRAGLWTLDIQQKRVGRRKVRASAWVSRLHS